MNVTLLLQNPQSKINIVHLQDIFLEEALRSVIH